MGDSQAMPVGPGGEHGTRIPAQPPPRAHADHRQLALELLRIGMGAIWAVNLVFIVFPPNQYFPTFRSTAASFAPTTIGGPGLADFVGSHATVFAWGIAVATAYLAVALLLGLTTKWACIVGAIASGLFLVTQIGSTFQVPGGTDVGPHPLYLLVYLILFAGGAGHALALDPQLAAALRPDRRWVRRLLFLPDGPA